MEKPGKVGKVRTNGSCGVCGDDMPAYGGYGINVTEGDVLLGFVTVRIDDLNREANFDERVCGIPCASALYQLKLQGVQGVRPVFHTTSGPAGQAGVPA